MSEDDHDFHEIRRIAYRIWLEEGQPVGRDREHWEAAKEMWTFQSRDSSAAGSDTDTRERSQDLDGNDPAMRSV